MSSTTEGLYRAAHSISSHSQKNRVAPGGKYHCLPHKYDLLRHFQNVKTSYLAERSRVAAMLVNKACALLCGLASFDVIKHSNQLL